MQTFSYFGGKIIPTEEVKVSAYDIGLLRGYAIYEGITAFGSEPFYLKEHLDRFERSAKILNLNIPLERSEIENIMRDIIAKNGFPRTNFRMILTGGTALDGIGYNSDTPAFFILSEPHKPLPQELYENGGSLFTHEHLRFLPECKTTNYITAVSLQKKKKEEGAVEILYTWHGKVLEASTSNFFIVQGNTLVTPKDDILYGITRNIVLMLGKGQFDLEERDITLDELFGADEAFITSSYKDIVPIVSVDGKKIGNGRVGEGTRKIMALFKDLAQQKLIIDRKSTVVI